MRNQISNALVFVIQGPLKPQSAADVRSTPKGLYNQGGCEHDVRFVAVY